MLEKSITILTGTFVTLLATWVFGWLLFVVMSIPVEAHEDLDQTEAIIVLTGGENRINAGFDLLVQSKAKQLFISGVNEQVQVKDLVEIWDPGRKKPPCCITLGYTAEDTEENAKETQEWVKNNQITSLRLVTSNYHMMRSYMEFRNAMPDVSIVRHPVTPEDFGPWSKKFWTLTFGEYNKTLLTWFRLTVRKNNKNS